MFTSARVQYRLASEFLLPPSNMDLYSSAMALYNRALQGSDSPYFKSDAAFNLAQAFSAVADITDEYQGPDGAQNARELRVAATQLMGPVLTTQIIGVEMLSDKKDDDAASEAAAAHTETGTTSTAAVPEQEEIDVDGEDTKTEREEVNVSVEKAPTPDALVDTTLFLVDIGTTLWDSVTPPQPPSEGEQQAMREMLDMASRLGPPGRQAEIDLANIKVLLTLDSIMWDMFRAQAQPGSGVERGCESAAKVLERLLESLGASPPDDTTVKADILATLANTEVAGAQRYVTLAKRSPTPAPLAQSAWALLSSATQHLAAAADLPVTLNTPKEFRPNCYIELAKVTLDRARLAPYNDTAAHNVQQLFDNCSAYAGKAAAALGWNFPRLPTASTTTPFFTDDLSPPYPAGWDMEMLSRTLALLLLRICFFAIHGGVLKTEGAEVLYEHAAKSVVDAIISVSSGPRRLMPKDIARFVGDIEDEEGGVCDAEVQWWEQVRQGILRGLPPAEAAATEAQPSEAQ